MKKLWSVLLALGLIVAFSSSAMAVDVKVNGEYYAAGMYLDKTSLQKNVGPNTAFYYQRLRLGTEFVVHPGLSLVIRADIMERAWGATRSTPGSAADTQSAGTRSENENIAFDLMYIKYASPVGIFFVGYQPEGMWGTVFGNTEQPTPKIMYIIPVGQVQIGLYTGKNPDGEKSAGTFGGAVANASDRDTSFYTAFARYLGKSVQGGFLFKYLRYANNRDMIPGVLGYKTDVYIATPYVSAKLGPMALQAEAYYAFGKAAKFEESLAVPQQDVSISQLTAWIDATADFGKVYIGGSMAYVQGDDPGTEDKKEGGVLDGGREWKPCLLMFNSDLNYWVGTQPGYNGTATGGALANAWFFQLRGGVRPVEKLDIMASVSYANADKKPAGVLNNAYGYELDITGTYKITNNLSYMIGAAYLFTGDYFKGATTSNNDLNNNYLVINKLTLTF